MAATACMSEKNTLQHPPVEQKKSSDIIMTSSE